MNMSSPRLGIKEPRSISALQRVHLACHEEMNVIMFLTHSSITHASEDNSMKPKKENDFKQEWLCN